MTLKEALDFLEQHQPMPADDTLDDDLIGRYEEVRGFLEQNPEELAVPLLLNSFGEGDGFGVYQRVEDVLVKLPNDVVLPHLLEALRSPIRSVRSWSAELASAFPNPILLPALEELLAIGESDERSAAITALEQMGGRDALLALQRHHERERDPEIVRFLDGAIRRLS